MEFKMRALNSQIHMAEKYIRAKLAIESTPVFNLRERYINEDDSDTFLSWQLEINIEIAFVKMQVFLEYLKMLKMAAEYKIDQNLLSAGLRAYVAHKGTPKDFRKLCLPVNKIVVTEKIEIENGHIFLTLLSGDHTDTISMATRHQINLTEKLFAPHFNFIKEKYPNWIMI